MRDDEADATKNEATTIPPPAGESDIYEAKTQVGGLPPEALEMLRALRDEAPSPGHGAEANVPVFVEEEEAQPSRPRPAAGVPSKPAETEEPKPSTDVPVVKAQRDPFAPEPPPQPPAEPAPAPKPELRPSRPPSPAVLSEEEAVPPVFSTSNPPVAPVAKDSIPPLIGPGTLGVSDMDDDNYAAVFGPLPPSTAHPLLSKPPPPPAAPGSAQIPMIMWVMGGLVVVVFLALFWVILTRTNAPTPPPADFSGQATH
jgi:hypothetical protein